MKALGYARCAVCDELLSGYAPRGWQVGDPLHVWAHGAAGLYQAGAFRRGRIKCDGSYKPGVDTRLFEDLRGNAPLPPSPPKAAEREEGR